MPEAFTILGVAVNGVVLAVMLSALAGWLCLLMWARRGGTGRSEAGPDGAGRRGPWTEMAVTAGLIEALVWKFGIVWRDPSLLWERPSLLLATSGGGTEAAAGAALAGVYWLAAARRRGVPLRLALDAAAVGAAGGLIAWCLLSAPAYRWAYAAVNAIVLYAMLRRRSGAAADAGAGGEAAGSGGGAGGRAAAGAGEAGGSGAADAGSAGQPAAAAVRAGEAAVLFGYGIGAGCLAVSLFAPLPPGAAPDYWLALSGRQWLFIALVLVAALLDSTRRRTEAAG